MVAYAAVWRSASARLPDAIRCPVLVGAQTLSFSRVAFVVAVAISLFARFVNFHENLQTMKNILCRHGRIERDGDWAFDVADHRQNIMLRRMR